MRTESRLTGLFIFILVIMVALACRSPLRPARSPDQPLELPPSLPPEEEAIEPDLLRLVPPELPGTTIPLAVGGEVFVPDGALPAGTELHARIAEGLPMLPEGLEPVGQGLVITSDVQPAAPVILRLPIPSGVADPGRLVVVRVETNGKATLLMTEVDGDALMALTPGFSQFILADFLDILEDQQILITGPLRLAPGQPATYTLGSFMTSYIAEYTFGASWQISEHGQILTHSNQSATIQAGDQEGAIVLNVEFIDIQNGLRWWGGRYIDIARGAGFRVSLVTDTPYVDPGDQVRIQADVHGDYTPPISWSYNFGDGGADGHATTNVGSTAFELPVRTFAGHKYAYHVRVSAQDANGINESATLIIQVYRHSRILNLEGEQHLQWASPEVRETYLASARGQDKTYRFDWLNKPGSTVFQYISVADGEHIHHDHMVGVFPEPGDYQIEVALFDITGGGEQALSKAVLPVFVEGGDPLDAHILDWPLENEPDTLVSVRFRVGGGRLIVGGQKGGYTVTVDWDDGNIYRRENVAIARTGYEPTIFDLSHQWQEEGTYVVRFEVEDPTGAVAYDQATILVSEEAAQVYSGQVAIVEYETEHRQALFQLRIDKSQVDLTVHNEIVSASIDFQYSFNLYIYNLDHPDRYCRGHYAFWFKGEGPLTEPFSLVLNEEDFKFEMEGPSCDKVTAPNPGGDGVISTTLTGTFFDDGSFYGTLDPDQYVFRRFGVFADLVE